MTKLKLCILGATGRMGALVAREALPEKFEISGAVAGPKDARLGKTLQELGIAATTMRLSPPSGLPALLDKSDVCISFTNPQAEIENLQHIARAGVPYVSGTTGLTPDQRKAQSATLSKVPAVIASNFSVGANFLIAISERLKSLPKSFEVSIVEAHHSGKADAPSGTALSIAEQVKAARGYSKIVSGRSGLSKRAPDELEVASLRGGGTPGIHTVHAFGPHEMITLEHLAFSRSSFALGALHAAEWVTAKGREPRVYGMADVLGLSD